MKFSKHFVLLGVFLALSTVVVGCGQPERGLETGGLPAEGIYARLEQAMKRPGQVFHTVVQVNQEAGLLSYQGRFELWADALQGRVRQVSDLTPEGGNASLQETVLADGVIYDSPQRGTPASKHRALQCPEASVLVSTAIACWRFDQAGETSVEGVKYQGVAAVMLATKVGRSGSDETFDVTRRLYLDAETFLPIALQFDGTVDYGDVLTLRGQWTYENDFLPLDSLPDDFFVPASIGYVEPDAGAPPRKSGPGLTVY